MHSAPQLAKALLIPMVDNEPDRDEANHIQVQFNPETLKVTLSNSLKADNKGGNNGPAAQFIEKSESTLSIELLFDTTAAATHQDALQRNCAKQDNGGASTSADGQRAQAMDVRKQTKCIADRFMKSPDDPKTTQRPAAPARCRFQWGSFVFVGMLSSYNETLEYFSPEGIPLRAKLSLSLKEDRYQFEQLAAAAAQRAQPTLSPAASNLPQTLSDQRQDPKNWRDTALFNGIENPRLQLGLQVSVPKIDIQAKAGASFNAGVKFQAGASARLGTSVPGAFVEVKPPKVSLNAQAKASLNASVGASLNTSANNNAGVDTLADTGPSIRLRN